VTGRDQGPEERRYVLELAEREVERYRLLAEQARADEADLWELAGIGAGARVADVGCGPGAMLPALSSAVGPQGRVHAVDGDPAAVAAARALVAAAGLGNVSVTEARADRTGLEAGSLDAVMLRHVLAHNGGAEDAIVAHLATLVRPGGCLYLVDADGTAIRTLPEHADLTDLNERYGAFRTARGDDNRAGLRLADRLVRAGLEVLELRGRHVIGQPPAAVRPPSWAARRRWSPPASPATRTSGAGSGRSRRWRRRPSPRPCSPPSSPPSAAARPERPYNRRNSPADRRPPCPTTTP
jgi:SAM-dependent methyltransferase